MISQNLHSKEAHTQRFVGLRKTNIFTFNAPGVKDRKSTGILYFVTGNTVYDQLVQYKIIA